jgi:hypothetical protein
MSNKTELQGNNTDLATILYVAKGLPGALPTTGGTMSGYIVLHADPTEDFHPATKQYVDNAIAIKIAEAEVG